MTEADLEPLPLPLQRYLRFVGVVGQPRPRSLRVRMHGELRNGATAPWMKITAEQHSFFDEPTRLFLLDASLYGVPFQALHMLVGEAATMEVKVASLIPVMNARGPQMNQSETVTMFDDMCLLAPATLVGPDVRWEPIDELRARGTYTRAGNTITAELGFAATGELVELVSDDRYASADGKTFTRQRWSTPVRDYRQYGPVRLASHGEAVWHPAAGGFAYARFEIDSVEYDVPAGG